MKKLTKLLSVFLIAGAVGTGTAFAAGCSHKHSFSGDWTVENGQHWHQATCEHTGEKAELGDCVDEKINATKAAGKDNLCDVCGTDLSVVTGIELNETGISVKVNGEFTLVATISPASSTGYTVEWKSDKPEIATVSNEGVVKGVAKGIATITVKAGGKSATCTVNVTDEGGTVITPTPDEKYSVTYVINGHGVQPENKTEQTALPATLPELTEAGWIFEGWYTDSGFQTKATAGATLTANATLYAKWEKKQEGEQPVTKYSITYVINGHGTQPDKVAEAEKLPATLPELTEAGWTFNGWYTDSALSKKAAGGTALTENTTLYASWTKKQSEQPTPDTKYSVTYVINGHGKQPDKLNDVTALPEQFPKLTANGWTFGGWYTDDGTFAAPATAGAAITANTTLYAKWTKKASTVVGTQMSEADFKAAIQATLDTAQFTYSAESESVKVDEINNAFIAAGGRYVVYDAQAKQLVKYSPVSGFAWEKEVINTNVSDFTAAKKIFTGDMIDTLQAFLDADYSTVAYDKDTDRYSLGGSYLTFDDGKVYTFASSGGAEKTLSGYGAEIALPDLTLAFENILIARTAKNEVGTKLPLMTGSSGSGLYAKEEASDNCVEITASGYQQKTKQGGSGLETYIVLGAEGNIEGYFELSSSAFGSSWDIIQFISGGVKKFCVNILDKNGTAKYNLGTGNSGTQTSPLTATAFTAKTQIRYSLTKPAAGGNYKLTLTVNGEPFVTNLDIGTDTVDRITLPASNIKNGPRNLTIDKVIVCGTTKAGTAKPVQSIDLNKYETRIEQIGGKETLVATITPADAAATLTWTSSDTSVATVDSNGVVTAVGDGTAVITATAPNGKCVSCTVNVGEKSLPMYNVSFVSDDKTVYSQTIEKGDCAVEPDELRKPGYIFKGWYLDEDGEEEYVFTTPVQGSLILYAVWDVNETLVDPAPEIPVASNIKIKRAAGDQESAYLEWTSETNDATWFNVYCKIEGGSFVKLDGELIRQYEDGHYRADAVGLKGGKYSMKIVPCSGNTENDAASLTVSNLVVRAHERTGFAFVKGNVPGAYNMDGTLKTGAQVVYVTAKTAKTVTATVNGQQFTGFQSILDARKQSSEPICFRIVGTINLADLDHISSSAEGLQVKGQGTVQENKATSNITIEGVGEDATINGFGILIRNCKNVELGNFGVINFMDDGISIDTGNSNLWVHNLDLFYGSAGGDSDQAKGDGSLDSKASDYCTYSYNHFWDSGKCNLLGNGTSESSGEGGVTHLTYHHNWYDHSDSRHPRIRMATVHVYNNYFDGNSKYGVGVTQGANAFVENNYFRSTAPMRPMMSSKQGTDARGDGTFSGENGGMIKAFGNVYDCLPVNLKLITQKDAASDDIDCYEASTRNEQVPATYKTKAGGTAYNNFDTASDFYSYEVHTAEDAQFLVTKYAGRVGGGDLKWTFDNETEDANYGIIPELKAKVVAYKSTLSKVNNESIK